MISARDLLKTEEGFEEIAKNELEPFLATIEVRGKFESFDGTQISYRKYINPDAKAEVMLVHGFSEFADKYNEMIYNFYSNSYSVYITELRGHGESQRFAPRPDMVYVDKFDDYVEDIKAFYNLTIKDSKLPKYILGQSMGGAISILYTEKYTEDFDKAVFASPMVRMRTGKYPFFVVGLIAGINKLLGKGKSFAPGQNGFNPESRLLNSSCKSKERYEYIMNKRRGDVVKQTWSGCYSWVYAAAKASNRLIKDKNVAKITIPALVLRAGQDHMVDSEYIKLFADKLPNGKYVFFPESRHEIYHANPDERCKFYDEIFEFLK